MVCNERYEFPKRLRSNYDVDIIPLVTRCKACALFETYLGRYLCSKVDPETITICPGV